MKYLFFKWREKDIINIDYTRSEEDEENNISLLWHFFNFCLQLLTSMLFSKGINNKYLLSIFLRWNQACMC